jgi:type IV pilus assembly protein PilE
MMGGDMNGRHARGFTLMECLIVATIVGIFASIAYPTYVDAVRKTRRAEARAAMMQLMQQEERFYTQNTRYIAFSAESTDADERKFKWYSGDSAATSAYEIAAAACEDETIRDCIALIAMPGTGRVNTAYKDPDCGTLKLTSTGARSATGGADSCWK